MAYRGIGRHRSYGHYHKRTQRVGVFLLGRGEEEIYTVGSGANSGNAQCERPLGWGLLHCSVEWGPQGVKFGNYCQKVQNQKCTAERSDKGDNAGYCSADNQD